MSIFKLHLISTNVRQQSQNGKSLCKYKSIKKNINIQISVKDAKMHLQYNYVKKILYLENNQKISRHVLFYNEDKWQ